MTNLPIMSSAPQAAAVAKQPGNAPDSGDTQGAQPFGEVLARQIREPEAKDARTDSKLLPDALGQLVADITSDKAETTDTAQADAAAVAPASSLPADMLAALLPQVINTGSTAAAPAENKTETPLLDKVSAPDTRSVTRQRADPAAALPGNAAMRLAPEARPTLPVRAESLAAALAGTTAGANSAPELNAVREALPTFASASPQTNAAVIASLQSGAVTPLAAVVQPVQVAVNTAITQDKWADEFNQKITWLASAGKDQTAELHLNPPQLGPLDVVIKVSGDQATALFTSPHAAVRDAIEQAMPRLRDMMADNGIMLGNATVSDQAPRDPNQSGAQRAANASGNDIRESASPGASAPRVSPIARHNGIVDTFA